TASSITIVIALGRVATARTHNKMRNQGASPMRSRLQASFPRLGTRSLLAALAAAMLIAAPFLPHRTYAEEQTEVEIALSLAAMLQSARSVISNNQDLINDSERGDKGLTGDKVLAAAIEAYKKETSRDPMAIDPSSRHG